MIKAIAAIIKVFADNNLFNEGVELIGSWCFQLYQKHLGAKSFPLQTQDIDFLIPNPFPGKEHLDFIAQLEALGFTKDFKRDGSLYLWNTELKSDAVIGISVTVLVQDLFRGEPLCESQMRQSTGEYKLTVWL